MRLWQALESMPVAAAVETEWRQRIGAEFDHLASLMKPEQGLATAFPCYGTAGSVCVHDVVHHGDGSIVAVCRSDSSCCGSGTLKREDLIVYRFDVDGVCRAIARLLGVAANPAMFTGLDGVHGVGVLDDARGARQPVALLLADPDTDASPEVVLERMLARYAAMSFACLVPTRAGISIDVESRLANAGCSVLACSEVVTLDANGDLALAEGARLLLATARRPGLPSTVREPRAPYVVTSAPHCLLIDNGGERPVTLAEYQALRPEEYDLFIDTTTTGASGRYKAARRNEHGTAEARSLTKNQAAALVELVAQRRALRATEIDSLDVGHPDKVIEKGRSQVDVRIARYGWRSFKTLPDGDSAAKRYRFDPPVGLRFAVVRPMVATDRNN